MKHTIESNIHGLFVFYRKGNWFKRGGWVVADRVDLKGRVRLYKGVRVDEAIAKFEKEFGAYIKPSDVSWKQVAEKTVGEGIYKEHTPWTKDSMNPRNLVKPTIKKKKLLKKKRKL